MRFIELPLALNLAMAYLDPGSGSILIQLIISALVGVGFYVRARWGKIKKFFNKSSSENEHTEVEDDDFDV